MSNLVGTQPARLLRGPRMRSGSAHVQKLCLLVPLFLGVALAIEYINTNAGTDGEPAYAAITLLKEGMIGNPYGFPTGPTAHVSPLNVLWLATAYWLFGIGSPGARLALSGFNLLCYVACCALAIGV